MYGNHAKANDYNIAWLELLQSFVLHTNTLPKTEILASQFGKGLDCQLSIYLVQCCTQDMQIREFSQDIQTQLDNVSSL